MHAAGQDLQRRRAAAASHPPRHSGHAPANRTPPCAPPSRASTQLEVVTPPPDFLARCSSHGGFCLQPDKFANFLDAELVFEFVRRRKRSTLSAGWSSLVGGGGGGGSDGFDDSVKYHACLPLREVAAGELLLDIIKVLHIPPLVSLRAEVYSRWQGSYGAGGAHNAASSISFIVAETTSSSSLSPPSKPPSASTPASRAFRAALERWKAAGYASSVCACVVAAHAPRFHLHVF